MRLFYTISDIMDEQEKQKVAFGIEGIIDNAVINSGGIASPIKFEAPFRRRMETSTLLHKTPYKISPSPKVDCNMLSQLINQQLSTYSKGLYTIEINCACNDNTNLIGPSTLDLIQKDSAIYCIFTVIPTHAFAKQRFLRYTQSNSINNQTQNADSQQLIAFAERLISFSGKINVTVFGDGVGDYEGTWLIKFSDYQMKELKGKEQLHSFALSISNCLKELNHNCTVRSYSNSLGIPTFVIIEK